MRTDRRDISYEDYIHAISAEAWKAWKWFGLKSCDLLYFYHKGLSVHETENAIIASRVEGWEIYDVRCILDGCSEDWSR